MVSLSRFRKVRVLMLFLAVALAATTLSASPVSAGSSWSNDVCARFYNFTKERNNGDFYYYASTVRNQSRDQFGRPCSFTARVQINQTGSHNNRGLGGDGAHTGPWNGNAVISVCGFQVPGAWNQGTDGRASVSYVGHLSGPFSSHTSFVRSGTDLVAQEGTCMTLWD